ncbi:MAG TPA: O-methyltransferase [Tetrasphaera sp.]|jgi:predicted O-methyltransferase YrrM|nr:O-methyltransferase [Tetrasphaera sp.]
MSGARLASWAYAEDFVAESEAAEAARRLGAELGATPIGTGTGAALRLLAAAGGARAVMEIGTGGGTSGLWLLSGMPADGVLTTIDVDAEHSRAARAAYAAAGVAHQRTRVISGAALDVLPRMTDGAYDLVFIDADKPSYPAYVEHAVRLLRPGGILALDNMLWHDKVADPAARDKTTATLRELGKSIREDERLMPSLLPVGDGLLAAVKK